MASPPRAVLDTNVFLRIILSTKPEGVAAALWQLLETGRFRLVVSQSLLSELRDTLLVSELAELHGWTREAVSQYVETVREIAVTVPGTSAPDLPALAQRDPSDLTLIAAALEGEADVLVSQDRDLLDLAAEMELVGLEVLDPLAFLRKLRALERP